MPADVTHVVLTSARRRRVYWDGAQQQTRAAGSAMFTANGRG